MAPLEKRGDRTYPAHSLVQKNQPDIKPSQYEESKGINELITEKIIETPTTSKICDHRGLESSSISWCPAPTYSMGKGWMGRNAEIGWGNWYLSSRQDMSKWGPSHFLPGGDLLPDTSLSSQSYLQWLENTFWKSIFFFKFKASHYILIRVLLSLAQ